MIKVPATQAGYSAMETLASEGIAVNATLIFSLEQALNCARAFERASHKASVDTVISVFVSRIDRAIDETLRLAGIETGKMGILNAADIYNRVEALSIPKCRVLFASTGVKGSEFRASYYIDELLAYNSVNTASIVTIDAFVDSGDRVLKLPINDEVIDSYKTKVANARIDMDTLIDQQISEGLDAFKVAFSEILSALE